jgi:hypothetical protein
MDNSDAKLIFFEFTTVRLTLTVNLFQWLDYLEFHRIQKYNTTTVVS